MPPSNMMAKLLPAACGGFSNKSRFHERADEGDLRETWSIHNDDLQSFAQASLRVRTKFGAGLLLPPPPEEVPPPTSNQRSQVTTAKNQLAIIGRIFNLPLTTAD